MGHYAFRERAKFFWPCVALNSILTDDICTEANGVTQLSLREEVSRDGVFYLSVIKYLPADLYLARVASDPANLGASAMLAFFTEEQLLYMLPWDIRTQDKAADEIIPAIYAHAAVCQPVCRLVVAVEQQAQPEQDFSVLAFHSLSENIEITRNELHTAIQEIVTEQQEDVCQVGASRTKAAHLLQQALLRAALDTLMHRLWETPGKARSLGMQAQCKLLILLRRWQERTRQQVVRAVPRWCEVQRQVVFVLTIGLPIRIGSVAVRF